MATLCHYLRRGWLYIIGGGLLALGGWILLLEFFLHLTFSLPSHVIWSPFPCATLAVFGMMLIIIAIVKPLKESLKRVFYVGKM